jgi:hypothetical protein
MSKKEWWNKVSRKWCTRCKAEFPWKTLGNCPICQGEDTLIKSLPLPHVYVIDIPQGIVEISTKDEIDGYCSIHMRREYALKGKT